jgi:pimeloyl-ACP methyl ester carboxylesterase
VISVKSEVHFGANCDIYCDGSSHIILYFHGFPGPHLHNLNPTVAPQLASALCPQGMTLVAPQFPGLVSSPGKFKFSNSVQFAINLTKSFLDRSKISFVGYSWGGFVATQCLSVIPPEKLGSVVLMAPLSQPVDEGVMEKVVDGWQQEFSDKLSAYKNTPEVVRDFIDTVAISTPESVFKALSIPPPVHIIHGIADTVVPFTQSFELCMQIQFIKARLIAFADQGHDFADRTRLMQEIRFAFQMDSNVGS